MNQLLSTADLSTSSIVSPRRMEEYDRIWMNYHSHSYHKWNVKIYFQKRLYTSGAYSKRKTRTRQSKGQESSISLLSGPNRTTLPLTTFAESKQKVDFLGWGLMTTEVLVIITLGLSIQRAVAPATASIASHQ